MDPVLFDSDFEEENVPAVLRDRRPRRRQRVPTPPPPLEMEEEFEDIPDDPVQCPDMPPKNFNFIFVRNVERQMAYPLGPIFPVSPEDPAAVPCWKRECYYLVEAWLGKWKRCDTRERPAVYLVMHNIWWLREYDYYDRFEYWSAEFCKRYGYALYGRMTHVYHNRRVSLETMIDVWHHDDIVDWMTAGEPSNNNLPDDLYAGNNWFNENRL